MAAMSGEILTILAVGIALAGLMLSALHRLEGRLNARMDRIEARVSGTETELSAVRERMGRIEGLLDGLREAVAGQRDAINDLRERFTRRAIA